MNALSLTSAAAAAGVVTGFIAYVIHETASPAPAQSQIADRQERVDKAFLKGLRILGYGAGGALLAGGATAILSFRAVSMMPRGEKRAFSGIAALGLSCVAAFYGVMAGATYKCLRG